MWIDTITNHYPYIMDYLRDANPRSLRDTYGIAWIFQPTGQSGAASLPEAERIACSDPGRTFSELAQKSRIFMCSRYAGLAVFVLNLAVDWRARTRDGDV